MRAKAIGALLGAVATAALLLPGAAGAKPGAGPAARGTQPETVAAFKVKGTNGFTVAVTLHDRHRLSVAATALSHSGQGSSATYILAAPQAPGSDGIVAKLGKLGQIDVRFVPGSVKETAPTVPGCHGANKVVIEEGHFVGLIRFRGEHGYTQVQAGHAAGTITRTPALTCASAPQPPKAGKAVEKEAAEAETEEAKEVELSATADRGRVVLSVSRLEFESKAGKKLTAVSFVAGAGRHSGKIQELSFALVTLLKGSAFLSPDPLHPTSEAVIRPSSPFSGSGTFRREAGKPASWTGDLKADLPGFGLIPLAGKGTRAAMCEAPGCHF